MDIRVIFISFSHLPVIGGSPPGGPNVGETAGSKRAVIVHPLRVKPLGEKLHFHLGQSLAIFSKLTAHCPALPRVAAPICSPDR